MTATLRLVGAEDAPLLADIFRELDATFLRPHPFTDEAAEQLAAHEGQDVYALLMDDGRPVAYGMLRGWDEGYRIPTLGIGVRTKLQGRGYGRTMMTHLHAIARGRDCPIVRLRVHAENTRALLLYESMGYVHVGLERGELVMLFDLVDADPAARAAGEARAFDARLVATDAPEWAEVLRRTRHDFYHLAAYLDVTASQEHGRALGLYVAEGDAAMLLPLVQRDIDGEFTDVISPYGYPGPLFTTEDESFRRLALAAARQVLQQAGIVTAFVRLHPIMHSALTPGLGLVVEQGVTVSIDLTITPQDRWAQLRSNHRRDITRAMAAGWTARVDETWEHLATFRRLYRETMRRRNATAFYLFDDDYFDGLRAALGDRLALIVVEREGEVASAGLFVVTCDIAEYHLSGTNEAHMQVQPLKLMLHGACDWARARGATLLHLGGGVGAADDSLLHFKLGFSRRTHPFSTYRMVLDPATYRRLVRARDPGFDPRDVTGYFPVYRTPR